MCNGFEGEEAGGSRGLTMGFCVLGGGGDVTLMGTCISAGGCQGLTWTSLAALQQQGK